MEKCQFDLNPNVLESFLKKSSKEFTKQDLINFVKEYEIEMINFRYVAEDGKLKALNFVINSEEHLNQILTTGERVDGSSLFSFIGTGSSDLYVVPRYSTAFLNPFEEVPTMDIFCSYYDSEGKPLASSPEYILKKAHKKFKEVTGFTFKALGELEYYIIADKDYNEMFRAVDQKGYHAAAPYAKFEHIRREAMKYIAACGGKIKYGHSEVGNFTDDEFYYEQQEIEFLPCEAESATDQLFLGMWVLEKLCNMYNVNINFAPKLTDGKAGSGLHIHMMIEKDGKNMTVENHKLSDNAKKMIAGILDLADALTSFGNTTADSYRRLVPHQEAPTSICWGDRNRSVLIRVPLGWSAGAAMIKDANPQDKSEMDMGDSKQTFEIRSGDCTADLYLYMAAIIVAAQHGLEMPNGVELAQKLYVDVNIHKDENKEKLAQLNSLPINCADSADRLNKKRAFFEKNDIFPAGLIDNQIKKLKK